ALRQLVAAGQVRQLDRVPLLVRNGRRGRIERREQRFLGAGGGDRGVHVGHEPWPHLAVLEQVDDVVRLRADVGLALGGIEGRQVLLALVEDARHRARAVGGHASLERHEERRGRRAHQHRGRDEPLRLLHPHLLAQVPDRREVDVHRAHALALERE
ncbi:MAG: hypothetical protein ACK56I_37145, partial [bacterium]